MGNVCVSCKLLLANNAQINALIIQKIEQKNVLFLLNMYLQAFYVRFDMLKNLQYLLNKKCINYVLLSP